MPSIKNCLGLLGTLALQALATEHEVASAVCAESNLRNLGVAIKAQDASDGLQNVVNMLQVFHQQVDGQGQPHGGNSSDAESAPDADPRVSLTISASADPRLFQQYSESSVAIVEPETKLEVTVDHTGWASASNVDVSLASASNVAFRDISSGGVGRRHRPNGTSAVNSSFPDKTANQTHPIEVDTSQASKVFTASNASVYGTVANQTLQDEEEDDHSPIGWPSAPDRRLDFVHIPKNAGTAIENSGIEYGYRWGRFNKLLHGRRWTNGHWCSRQHLPPRNLEAMGIPNSKNTFCVSRHPYERIVSDYKYFQFVPWGKWHHELDLSAGGSRCSETGLNAFVDTITNHLLQGRKSVGDCHFIPQADYMWDYNGKRMCNHILDIGGLPDNFNHLMETHGLNVRLSPNKTNSYGACCGSLGVQNLTLLSKWKLVQAYKEDFDKLNFTVQYNGREVQGEHCGGRLGAEVTFTVLMVLILTTFSI